MNFRFLKRAAAPWRDLSPEPPQSRVAPSIRASADPPQLVPGQNPELNQAPGWYVPAGITFSQLLDYVSGTGDYGVTSLYSITTPTRETAMTYAAVFRCVTLVAGCIAQLVTGGGLRVVDQDGRTVRNNKAKHAVNALTHLPDGELPAYQWVEDVAMDYLLDGNYVVVAQHSSSMVRLQRCVPWQATAVRGHRSNQLMYEAHPVMRPETKLFVLSDNVCHGRWGLSHRHGYSKSGREMFAAAPVILMRAPLKIGLQADQYISDFFVSGMTGGARSNVAIGFENMLRPEQQEEIRDAVKAALVLNRPFVFGGKPTYTQLKDTPQDAEAEKLREFQVREAGRIWGVPAPLLGEQVTQWGAGIEQLAKLYFRFGNNQHLARFFAPLEARLLDPGHRFDVDDLTFLRGDYEAIAQLITALQGDEQRPPVAFVEEMRRLVGLSIDRIPPDERIKIAQAKAKAVADARPDPMPVDNDPPSGTP